ncbi:hypothetical protein LINGRAHAP2_LOCUS24824 [Linum grandiflorum]
MLSCSCSIENSYVETGKCS